MTDIRILTSLLMLSVTACGGEDGESLTALKADSIQLSTSVTAGPLRSVTPIVFNASATARPGDVVFLQGHGFGDSPSVRLVAANGGSDQTLPLVNRVGNWVSVKIPLAATGSIKLTVVNGNSISAPVQLNAAKGYHLDALTIVPEGRFRIFGRNLQFAAKNSSVTVDGRPAQIDTENSNDHMLTVIAPRDITATPNAVITVNNGNGSGPANVERTAEVLTGQSQSPFDSSVGWTAKYRPLTGRFVELPCNNGAAVSAQIQSVVDGFGANGGIVQLSAGACTLNNGINLPSNVVLQGQGKWSTILTYTSNYPIYAENRTLIGLRNLTLKNSGAATEGPVIKNNNMVIFQNVVFDFGRQKQSFLDGNRNILVSSCDFFQRGSINEQSPYLFSGAKGLVFINNQTSFVMGAAAFERVSDAYIKGNTFTRDAAAQNDPGTIHMMTLDFASRIAVTQNTFNTANGVINNKTRNDGESLLTEGGGSGRTENLGVVSTATVRTIYDPSLSLNTNPLNTGSMPENYGIAIVAGTGMGQTRYITAFSNGTVTVDRSWDVIPDNTSKYATFVWGLEKSVIEANRFVNMPRGIWLYQTAIRDVDVTGNYFSEGGGIYLRAYQNLDQKMFDPIYNVRISDNYVSNTTNNWLSYASAIFVNSDARAFGTAFIGIEFRNNTLITNRPNISSSWEEYAGNEGYWNMMRVENYDRYEPLAQPRLLGTIFQDNACTNCAFDYRIGTGAGGTIIDGARSTNSGGLYDNWRTSSSSEVATETVIR